MEKKPRMAVCKECDIPEFEVFMKEGCCIPCLKKVYGYEIIE